MRLLFRLLLLVASSEMASEFFEVEENFLLRPAEVVSSVSMA